MKQPQLGHKILELRKAKGLTQEELVEKCNLNVRTLQRIEAGDVSPRSHTLKTIFEALNFEFEEKFYLDPQEILNTLQKSSQLSPDPHLTKSLGISLIAGGIYYILVFFEMGIEISFIKEYGEIDSSFWELWKDDRSPISPFWFVMIKILVMIAFSIFIRGFYLLGEKIKNIWLKSASLSYIVIFGFTITADLLFFFFPEWPIELLLTSKSILYGIGLFLFSISLLDARKVFGPLALVTGSLGMANGIFFVSLILALPGILFLTVVELLQLILLLKGRFLFSEKEEQEVSRPNTLKIADQL